MEPGGNKIWLVGEVSPVLPVGLPTIGDVLRSYFYHRFGYSKGKPQSFIDTAKELIFHLNNLGKTNVEQRDVVQRIKKIIELYDLLKKSKHRRTQNQIDDEKGFLYLLDTIFDIAPKVNYHHSKGQNLIQIDQQSQELNCIPDEYNDIEVDNIPKIDHQRAAWISEKDYDMEVELDDVNNNDSDDKDFETTMSLYHQSQFSNNLSDEDSGDVVYKIINSLDVSSALDRTNTSNGSFVIILAAIARALDVDLTECVFSTATLLRRRIAHREVIETTVKNEFLASIKSGLVVHWDGKRLKNTTADENDERIQKVERIAIVVTGLDVQKIIAIAKADDGTGVVASDTVHEHLDGWSILEPIVAMCTDTTSSNTGNTNGALVLFEKKMNRNLIYLACRHHMLELIIGAVFQKLFGETTGPNTDMFENFKRGWPAVKKDSFKVRTRTFCLFIVLPERQQSFNCLDHLTMPGFTLLQPFNMNLFKTKYLKDLRKDVITYIENILTTKDKQYVPRGDYLEMMELCLLVLGKPLPGYTFKLPQNCSNARWMGKCIYDLKMFLFRDQVVFSDIQLANLEQFCLFACLIYTKAWIQCCVPSNAPLNDLELLKSLNRYTRINAEIANSAIEKFEDHLWYLGSELVVLSLFSNNVNDNVKFRMFQRMKYLDNGQWIERNQRLTYEESIFKKELYHLVGPSSMTVLKSLKINIDFMFRNNVIDWKNLDDYKQAKQIVDSFKVVNDTAERALKMMTDYNESLTENESEMQRAIQVIEDNRQRIPSLKKSVLSSYTRRILPK